MERKKAGIYIAPNRRRLWAHELRVAEVLARNGHYVEFLPEGLLPDTMEVMKLSQGAEGAERGGFFFVVGF